MTRISNVFVWPNPVPSRPDPSCTVHSDIKVWECYEEIPPSQGGIKVGERDIWQSVNHGCEVGDCVFVTGDETAQKGYYRIVEEVQNNNSVRLDRPWDGTGDEGTPTDWQRLIRTRELNVAGFAFSDLWQKIDREAGDIFNRVLLSLLVQDAWPDGPFPPDRSTFNAQLGKLVVKIADNSTSMSLLRNRN